jgi:hypothetical protein
MNLAIGSKVIRPLAGLALVAGLLGAPLATAASAARPAAPTAVPAENPYCDYRSGYDCLSYGYPPDYDYGYPPDHGPYRHHHWHHHRG